MLTLEVGRLSAETDGLLDMLASLPLGVPYLCGVGLVAGHGKEHPDNTHAIVIDEDGTVLDPAARTALFRPLPAVVGLFVPG